MVNVIPPIVCLKGMLLRKGSIRRVARSFRQPVTPRGIRKAIWHPPCTGIDTIDRKKGVHGRGIVLGQVTANHIVALRKAHSVKPILKFRGVVNSFFKDFHGGVHVLGVTASVHWSEYAIVFANTHLLERTHCSYLLPAFSPWVCIS